MINCFTYTYKTLKREGYELPVEFEGYSMREPRKILTDYKQILEDKTHYAYFESFCTEVKKAQPNDIIVHKDGVGIAVNDMMYVTILFNPMRRILQKIDKRKVKIYRIGKVE